MILWGKNLEYFEDVVLRSSKEDRALLLLLDPVRGTGTDDCSATLIFIILSLKKCPKVLAKSVELK